MGGIIFHKWLVRKQASEGLITCPRSQLLSSRPGSPSSLLLPQHYLEGIHSMQTSDFGATPCSYSLHIHLLISSSGHPQEEASCVSFLAICQFRFSWEKAAAGWGRKEGDVEMDWEETELKGRSQNWVDSDSENRLDVPRGRDGEGKMGKGIKMYKFPVVK